jgi:hypothetical protein
MPTQVADQYTMYQPQNLKSSVYYSFDQSGIDNYPSGPNQNPAMFLDINNLMPPVGGGFQVRWGTSQKGTLPNYFKPVRAFSYHAYQDATDTTNTQQLDVVYFTDNQSLYPLAFTDAPGETLGTSNIVQTANPNCYPEDFVSTTGHVYAVESRNWLYYANGIEAPLKVNPSYFTKNTNSLMGIASPLAYYQNGSQAASSIISAYGGTGSGYTGPTVTISGGGGTGATATATLKNGTIVSFIVTNAGSKYSSTPTVEISDPTGSGAAAAVVYNDLGAVTAVLPVGPIVLNEGRTYTFVYKNSLTGHASDLAQNIQIQDGTTLRYTGDAATVLSPISGVLGNLPANVGFTQIVVTVLPLQPIDPQVDTLVLLATSDGGSLANLYEVAQIALNPFTSAAITYTDTLPDTYTDQTNSVATGGLGVNGVHARIYQGGDNGIFGGITSATLPVSTQDFNSLMFNVHPTTILPGYTAGSANQNKPMTNSALTTLGTWSDDVAVTGTDGDFQMILTGTFVVGAPGQYTLRAYSDAAYVIGIQGAEYVSGPQVFGGINTTPINGYPSLCGQNDDIQDWHISSANPQVINFPTAGNYPYEICYATADHDEREFALLANGAPIAPTSNGATNLNYTGLTLLNANLWVETDVYGNTYGVAGNQPPPTALLYLTQHQGRLFGTDGKTVFYSKSISDVTTSTGLITSKWEEAWPGENQLAIALDNETVTGLKSDGTTLHIGTTQNIYDLQGTDSSNFSVPNVLFQETGVLAHDLWTVIYSEGQPAGYMWVTPDYKVMYSDFSTYVEVGTPIYNTISLWNLNFTEYASMNSLTYGPYNLCVLTFQAGSETTQFLVYETRLKKWYRWTVSTAEANTVLCSAFVYQQPESGYRGLLFASPDPTGVNACSICAFDPATALDYAGGSFSWQIQTCWNPQDDPTAFKIINEIEVDTYGTQPIVHLYGATLIPDFTSSKLLKGGNLVLGPLGTYKLYCAGVPTKARYHSVLIGGSSADLGATPALPIDAVNRFTIDGFPVARI